MFEDVRQSRAVPGRRPEGDGEGVVVVVWPGEVEVLGAGGFVLQPHHRLQKQLRHPAHLGHLEALHLAALLQTSKRVLPPDTSSSRTARALSRVTPHFGHAARTLVE